MVLSAHITVGAAIGSTVGNPFLAVMISFISHYVLNCVPHWDPNFTKNKINNKIFKQADIILSFILTLLFSNIIPEYLKSHSTLQDVYPPDYMMINLPILNYSFSPVIMLCCLAAVLPPIISLIQKIFKKEFSFLKWNTFALNFFHIKDNSVMGKLVQIATIVVFSLYSFRLLPNSDSTIFVQIMIFMLIVVGLLAIIETFSVDQKKIDVNHKS